MSHPRFKMFISKYKLSNSSFKMTTLKLWVRPVSGRTYLTVSQEICCLLNRITIRYYWIILDLFKSRKIRTTAKFNIFVNYSFNVYFFVNYNYQSIKVNKFIPKYKISTILVVEILDWIEPVFHVTRNDSVMVLSQFIISVS